MSSKRCQATVILVDRAPTFIHHSVDNLRNLIHKGHHLPGFLAGGVAALEWNWSGMPCDAGAPKLVTHDPLEKNQVQLMLHDINSN